MEKLGVILCTLLVVALGGCTKKLDIAVQESQCKGFGISNVNAVFRNPICKGIKVNSLTITCSFSGEEKCIDSIVRDIKFVDLYRKTLTPLSVSAPKVFKGDPSVTITPGQIKYVIDFEMQTVADYENLSYVEVNFFTESVTLSKSNRLAVLENLPCQTKIIPPLTSQDQFVIQRKDIIVSLRDTQAEDGDILNVILNGVVVLKNIQIFNTPQNFSLTIDPTISNYISFYAVNEGDSSPNTAAGYVSDGFNNYNFDVDLKQGEQVAFTLIYQP
jgi:hypothetical protein